MRNEVFPLCGSITAAAVLRSMNYSSEPLHRTLSDEFNPKMCPHVVRDQVKLIIFEQTNCLRKKLRVPRLIHVEKRTLRVAEHHTKDGN